MGIINKLTKKCVFCKSRKDTKYITAYGIYGGFYPGNWYHDECLMEVACNPEKYNTRTVDVAVDIVERIKETKKIRKKIEKENRENCEYLKKHCV